MFAKPSSLNRFAVPLRPWRWVGCAAALAVGLGFVPGCDGDGDGVDGPRPVATVEVTPATVNFSALDQTSSLTAVAKDADGGVIPGVSFTWNSSDPSVASVSAGVVTAVGNGSSTITATADGRQGSSAVTVQQVSAQLAFSLQPLGGNKAGEPLATQPTVQVQDANGNRVAIDNTTEVTVALGANPGSATLSGTTSCTAVSGECAFTDLSIDIEGIGYTLMATAAGLGSAESNAFSVIAEIASIAVTPGAVTLESLSETVQLTAEATSTTDRVIPGLTFDWSAEPTSVCTVDANGLVTSVDNGSCTVTATANGVSGSGTVTVQQVPAQLGFSVHPVGGKAEEPLATQPTVQVQDANGFRVAGDNTTQVTVAIGTNPCGGTLSGNPTLTASSGQAAFTDLSIDIECIGYTLTASAGALTSDPSDPFDLARNIATVVVAPSALTLESLTETAQLGAEARSPSGRVIPDPDLAGDDWAFTWTADPTSVCTVDASGLVTAVDNGGCTVSAEADAVAGSAAVTVDQKAVQLSVSPDLAVLALAEMLSLSVEAFDALGHPIVSATITASCLDTGIATASGTDVTAVAEGVTDCVFSSDTVEDTVRVAVVAQKGFAAIFTTGQDTYELTAVSGASLDVDLWMIRPSGGDGDLGSIQGSLVWDPSQLTYVSSAIVEGGWTWIPNETNVGTGELGFAAFSATGTANTFVLARVTFTASGASGGASSLVPTVTAAGDALGADITALIQAVSSLVSIE